eukprot:8607015-Pyramimonas_sp.AAC.1
MGGDKADYSLHAQPGPASPARRTRLSIGPRIAHRQTSVGLSSTCQRLPPQPWQTSTSTSTSSGRPARC